MPEAFVQINPEDAHELRVREGQEVKVKSRRGELQIKVKVSPETSKGVVFIPFHFNGSNANVLTNPAFDPVCKMPEFKVCAVGIEKAGRRGEM